VLGGTGSIDVALDKGSRKIACEISVSSTPEYELQNIQKCLAAGYTPVLVISSNKRGLGRIKSLTERALTPESLERVRFIEPDALPSMLEIYALDNVASESTVKGYKVKVKRTVVTREDAELRKNAISKVLLKSLERLRRNNKKG
jgi:hypothetical protein